MVTEWEGRAGRDLVGLVVMGSCYVSLHPVFRTAQSTLHFAPRRTC